MVIVFEMYSLIGSLVIMHDRAAGNRSSLSSGGLLADVPCLDHSREG